MNATKPGHGTVASYGDDTLDAAVESVATSTVAAAITPEIVAVVQAAANEFVGSQVRILSVRVLSEGEQDSSSWAGQGRDIIHSSHNLVQRGR